MNNVKNTVNGPSCVNFTSSAYHIINAPVMSLMKNKCVSTLYLFLVNIHFSVQTVVTLNVFPLGGLGGYMFVGNNDCVPIILDRKLDPLKEKMKQKSII